MKSIRTIKDPVTGITRYKVKRKGKKEEKQKTLFWFVLEKFRKLSKGKGLDEKEKTHRISRAFTTYYRGLEGNAKHPKRQINLMCYSYLKKTRKLLGISTFKTTRRKTILGKKLLAA